MSKTADFNFRKFSIKQDQCAMKVGTDGVLLGAWARGGKRILDIGTGTGLIALMMAQRYEQSHVTAIEIDTDAAQQAIQNIEASPFSGHIDVVCSSIQEYKAQITFDCIVSNPPYFNDSLKNPDIQRATARHTDTLTFKELFDSVRRLLADDGEFSVIIPTESLQAFVSRAYLAGLTPTRKLAIRTTPRKQPKRYLVAFAKKATKLENEEQCLQSPDGTRSEWYAELTKDFYIK